MQPGVPDIRNKLQEVQFDEYSTAVYQRFCCKTCSWLHMQHSGFRVPAAYEVHWGIVSTLVGGGLSTVYWGLVITNFYVKEIDATYENITLNFERYDREHSQNFLYGTEVATV